MGIGASIFFIAVGLVLALAVHTTVSGIDINTIGWILVAVGAIGLAMTALIFAPRRRAVRESTIVRDAPVRDTVVRDAPVVEERSYREDV